MRSIISESTVSALLAIALIAVAACGGRPESDSPEGEEAGAEQETPAQVMASEGEQGGEEGAEGGGEHGREGEGEEGGEGDEHREASETGEHDEGGEHGEEGEESGVYLSRTENWDATRHGIRLRLAFDAQRDAFVGTAENTTDATVCAVRVEVHLRPGPELGPTERRDLSPGESAAVELAAGGENFEEWTAHPETSACRAA